MRKMKALIVDDEYAARETLNRLIDWGALGFDPPAFAANGIDALQAYDSEKYDIVFTDIEMPIMNGIEFIKEIRCKDVEQKVIIISCHEKFEYARDAMRLGVNDYLIKDLITPNELRALVCTVIAAAKTKIASPTSQSGMAAHLAAAALGKKTPDLSLCEGGAAVFRIIIDNYELMLAQIGKKSAAQLLDTLWSSMPCVAIDKTHEDSAYALFCVSESNSMLNYINGAITTANSLRQKARKLGLHSLSIGISDAIDNAAQLPLACKQASEASDLRVINGLNKTIVYNTIASKTAVLDFRHLESLFTRFEERASNVNMSCIKLIDALYEEELPCGFAEMHYYRYINMRLWSIVVTLAQSLGKTYDSVLSAMGLGIEDVDRLENAAKMANVFKSFLLNLFSSCEQRSADSIVDRALMLIEREYCDDISLNYIADALHTHKGYLCRSFKEETGENLVQYIINKKIERAKYLLVNTQMKLYEISESLGFATPQYFSHVFKKHEGQSPNEYKKKA